MNLKDLSSPEDSQNIQLATLSLPPGHQSHRGTAATGVGGGGAQREVGSLALYPMTPHDTP